MKNILVPIDLSAISDTILHEASQIASCFSSRLWILHVTDPDPAFMGYQEGPAHERSWKAENLHSQHKSIQQKAKELENKKLNITVTPLLLQGSTVDVILKQADKLDVDLIVMGMHGHGMIKTALLGSVSTGVVKTASCPVLLIPIAKIKN